MNEERVILFDHIDKHRGRYLFLFPTLNLILYPFLIASHWITGNNVYIYSILFLLLAIVYVCAAWNIVLNIRANKRARNEIIRQFIGLLLIAWAGYADLEFVWVAVNNNGHYPCNLGPSCP